MLDTIDSAKEARRTCASSADACCKPEMVVLVIPVLLCRSMPELKYLCEVRPANGRRSGGVAQWQNDALFSTERGGSDEVTATQVFAQSATIAD